MGVSAVWESGEASWSVIVHGGAGDIAPERRNDQVDGCRRAVETAAALLVVGGSALDAVERAVRVLEDDPRFNAGTGACLTSDGHVELDAALMDGSGLRAGAVCALRGFKNPIGIARAVLEDGEHVLYAAQGAAAFARQAGFEPVDETALVTESARTRLVSVLRGSGQLKSDAGTVGAVARDALGRVAAATSTGGVAGKRPGRVGDTPVIGAGTYADRTGAASATGQGEGILRVALSAFTVAELERGRTPQQAAQAAILRLNERASAYGGIIVVDALGRLGLARNTRMMAWAAMSAGELTASGA
jgi:beta-aspartyl-peptidase (threonine type)